MQVNREDLNPCTIQLTVVCDPDQVRAGFDRAFRQLTKKIRLPGFRPGHAPKSMLEGLVSPDDLGEAAADEIVRATLPRAIEQEGLQPDRSTRQMVDLTKIDRDSLACEFTAKVPLPAKVELGDYKGLPIERPSLEVTDEELDRRIEEIRRRGLVRESVTDRGVQEGDVAVLNIKVDGEADGRNFMTVSGQTFAELDGAVLGMRPEEMRHLSLPFPEKFQEKDWAGKTLDVTVTVTSITAVRVPELDDEFARSHFAENVSDLREKMRGAIRRAKEETSRQVLHDQLLDRLLERSKVQVSDNMWENLAQRRLRETAEEQAKQNKSLEDYAKESGMSLDEFVQAWRERAKTEVERALLIQRVFVAEKMQLTNAELNRELVTMASEYRVEPDQMVNMLRQNDALDDLQFRALSRKVSDFLLAHAVEKTPAGAGAT